MSEDGNDAKLSPLRLTNAQVACVLAGHKTAVRLPIREAPRVRYNAPGCAALRGSRWHFFREDAPTLDPAARVVCPFGAPGDLLWIRESWMPCTNKSPSELVYFPSSQALLRYDHSVEPPLIYQPSRREREKWTELLSPRARAVGTRNRVVMPLWAARIMLRVTRVRAERLSAMRCEEIEATEGLQKNPGGHYLPGNGPYPTWALQVLFEKSERVPIAESFRYDPWFWTVDFEIDTERTHTPPPLPLPARYPVADAQP